MIILNKADDGKLPAEAESSCIADLEACEEESMSLLDERFAETPDDYLFEPTEEGQVASLPAPELEADSEKPTECDDMNLRDEVVELLKDRGWTWFKDKLGKTYADIPSKKGSETVPIDSEAMRRQIRNLYHEVSGRGLSAGVVKDVCDTLDAFDHGQLK